MVPTPTCRQVVWLGGGGGGGHSPTYTDAAIMHSVNSVDDRVAEFNQIAKYATFCMVMHMLVY